jgi:hypothetical protein
VIDYMSLFPKEDILTKEEITSWKSFRDSLSSKEDRELFEKMHLNDCYKYTAAINAKGEPFPSEPLITALLLLSQHKMINRLTKQISKHETLVGDDINSKGVKKAKQQEKQLEKENTNDYIRKNGGRIHHIDDDYLQGGLLSVYEFYSGSG